MAEGKALSDLAYYYQAGFTQAELGRMFGLSHDAVTYRLKAEGVWVKNRDRSGPPRIQECQDGHDMEEWGREMKGGGRYCLLCKREREREGARRRYWAKKSRAKEQH